MKQHTLFPTIIHEYELTEDDLVPLRLICADTPVSEHSLVSEGAVSSYKNRQPALLDNPAVCNVREKIEELVNHYAYSNGLDRLQLSNSWFNKMGNGHYLLPHRHELSIVSGALYIDADPGSVGLRFHSPLSIFRMHEGVIYNTESPLSIWKEIPCQTGKLIIFPSWLEHSTLTNHTENRVVLSFNTSFANGLT